MASHSNDSQALSECSSLDEITKAITDYQEKEWRYAIRRDAANGIGFQFIQNKKKEMGLAVLEFNAEEFPQSPWIFESLSEAYSIAGDEERAVTHLKKLLELDPENVYAKAKLKELRPKDLN